jgi:predicted kinase
MQMKLILLVGPPGSGKSTYRNNLGNEYYSVSQDEQGKEGHMKVFNLALSLKEDIVVDRMHFDKKQRNRYLDPARKAGYEIEIVVFHVPRQICFDRIMERENHPTINGKKVIENSDKTEGFYFFDETEKAKQANSALDTFFTKYERVEDTEADKVTRLGWEWYHGRPQPKAIILDIDGTMANIDHRLHYMKQPKKNWAGFFADISKDSVNEWCRQIACRFQDNYEIIMCSGRGDNLRKETEYWLSKHQIPHDHLLMRHRQDHRADYIIKEIIYEFEIKPKFDVLFTVDDRKQVVDIWRKHGLVCLACHEGDF